MARDAIRADRHTIHLGVNFAHTHITQGNTRRLQRGIALLVVRTPLGYFNSRCEFSEELDDFFVLQLRRAIPIEFNGTKARTWTINRVPGTNITCGGTIETPSSANVLSALRPVGQITTT